MLHHTSHDKPTQPDDPLAIAAMILGVVSFTGLGFITGIPAIILASIALARKTPSRGLSVAGLIAGIVSTVLSVIVILFFVLLLILGASSGQDSTPSAPASPPAQTYSQGRV